MSRSADDGFALDRRAVARAFGRASPQYEAAARLQAEVRAELLGRLDHFALTPAVVVDAGAGTAPATAQLARRFPQATVIAFDLAHGMLLQAAQHLGLRDRVLGGRFGHPFQRVCGDVHRLPFATGSVQLVFSSLMLQWSDDLDAALRELRRVLAPGGMLTFSSFGPDTLRELREAWAAVDAAPRVSVFADMPDLASALQHARFSEPVLDADRLVRHYPQVRALLDELRTIGARNAAATRVRGLTSPRTLARMIDRYEHRRAPQGIPATWEVLYGAAFAAGAPGGAAGEQVVPLARVRRRRTPA